MALVLLAAQKPMRIVCAREIQNSLRESVKQLVEDKIKAAGLESRFECLDKETRGLNGSKFIYLGMWRNPEAAKSLEGADIFWGEEASAFSERSLRIIRPTMRKPGSELWFSWNPEFEHDPIDRFFRGEQGPPPDALVKEVSWRDNPWFAASPLRDEMEFDYRTDPAKAEHVWGGGYITAVEGAYYAAQLAAVHAEGRIVTLAREPILRVRSFWDLGRNDATSIWVAQFVDREIRVLDYIEGRGQELSYYISQMHSRGWSDAVCELPHDGMHVRLEAVGSVEQQLRAARFEVNVTPNQGKGAALERVEASRRNFPRIWFNDTADVRSGMKALSAYHERWDDNRNVGLGPEHDWASDPADAFGLMNICYEEPAEFQPIRRGIRGIV